MIGINHIENKQFGKVIEPYKCFDPAFDVYDEQNNLKYVISGECCQCGLCCKSLGKFYETRFEIYTVNDERIPSNSKGSIIRKIPNLVNALFTDADNFDVNFPSNATEHDKLMIIGATLMIDYQYFEDSGGDDKHSRHGF